jgi:hypothetical protein
MRPSPAARTRNAFVPRVEGLEDRNLLSVTVTDVGSVLRIRLDHTPNQAVQITDDGAGNITVVSGTQKVMAKGVTTILVRGGGPGDVVSYDLTAALSGVRIVDSHLRGGSNTFNATVDGLNSGAALLMHVGGDRAQNVANLTETGALNSGSVLVFNADGGPGLDRLNAAVTGNVNSGAVLNIRLGGGRGTDLESIAVSGDIAAGALVGLTEGGSRAADQESLTYNGVDHGLLVVNVDGGRGADVLTTNLNLGKGSDGTVLAVENGGPGNDSLTLNIPVQSGDKPTVLATLNGGPGSDACAATPNVHVINCEKML